MRIIKPIIYSIIAIVVMLIVFNTAVGSMGYSSWSDVIDILPFSRGFTKIVGIFTGMQYTGSAVLKSSFIVDLLKFVLIVIIGTALDTLLEIAFNTFGEMSFRNLTMIIVKFGIKIIGISVVIMYTSNLIYNINISLFNLFGNNFIGLLLRYLVIILVAMAIFALVFLIIRCLSKIDKNGTITSKLFLMTIKSLVKVFILIMLFIAVCTMFSNSDMIVTGSIILITIVGIIMLFDAIIH